MLSDNVMGEENSTENVLIVNVRLMVTAQTAHQSNAGDNPDIKNRPATTANTTLSIRCNTTYGSRKRETP